jgi:hypothetical protein
MTAPDSKLSWIEENQRALVAEFARLKSRIMGEAGEQATHASSERESKEVSAIDWLSTVFGLSTFERDVLLLCAGVEMDSVLARACAEANNNPQRPYVTFSLALSALAEPHWSALTPQGSLRRWRLVEVEGSGAHINRPLRIDERILHFLAGVNELDARLQSLVRWCGPGREMADSHRHTAMAALAGIRKDRIGTMPVQLSGDDPSGQEDVAAHVATALGLQLYLLRAKDVPTVAAELDAFITLWERDSVLLPAALLMQIGAERASAAAVQLIERLHSQLFVACREPVGATRPMQRYDINKPDALEQKRLWTRALGPAASRLNGALDAVSAHFRLSAQQIAASGRAVGDQPEEKLADALWHACRSTGRPRLEDLAQRIEPRAGWDDLVLPESQIATLKEIAAHVRHRLQVYEDWGFARKCARGLAASALFSGESGTGKTMAAEVLAGELNLDLYRIDLSSVVSKYIGETERNLRCVFDAAEDSGAILLFDEADALFGKRSEVKDSHDRYANIEVSYLLQRMEAFRGALAILTTNLRQALDTAFQRRIRFFVSFPFPDVKQRRAIWQKVFPVQTPTNGLDYAKLANLHVAGGSIRNIALNAAFLAAENREPVNMAHVLRAAHGDAAKRERPLADAETRGWV